MDHLKGRTELTEINQEEVQALGLLADRLRTHRRQNKTSMKCMPGPGVLLLMDIL